MGGEGVARRGPTTFGEKIGYVACISLRVVFLSYGDGRTVARGKKVKQRERMLVGGHAVLTGGTRGSGCKGMPRRENILLFI